MNFNNYLNLNKSDADSFLKLFKVYQEIIEENKILKNALKIQLKRKSKAEA